MKLIEIRYSSRTHLNLLFFLSFFALSGCGKDAVPTRPPEPDPVPSRMVISPPSGSLTASGQTLQLTATLFDANGSPLTGFEIAWSSSNTAVATVDRNGLVTAHSGGTTQIIAAWGGVRNNITVMVSLGPSRIVVTPESVRFKARGETRQLEAVVLDADDVPIADASVNWSSDNPAVVFVNSRGEVKANERGSPHHRYIGFCIKNHRDYRCTGAGPDHPTPKFRSIGIGWRNDNTYGDRSGFPGCGDPRCASDVD